MGLPKVQASWINYPHLIAGGLYEYLMEFDIGRKRMVMERFASVNVTPWS